MEFLNGDYLTNLTAKYGHLKGELVLIDLNRNQSNQCNLANTSINTPLANLTNVQSSSCLNYNLGTRNGSLGLSLAGNKDRSVYSVFVCGIHPNGLAARDGRIKIGDQLIEANGVPLLGRCHLNAGAILQQLPDYQVKLVILRKIDAINEMAVKPLPQFYVNDTNNVPGTMTRESSFNFSGSNFGLNLIGGKLEKCKNLARILTLRKTTVQTNLGLLISEGKHPDLGKGVFVSDVQANSIAEASGICVGDMIISINQMQLIGADCETASNLLKNADGLVTFIIVKAYGNSLEEYNTMTNIVCW